MRGWLPRNDVLLAVVLALLAVPSAALGLPDDGPVALTVPVALLMSAGLAWRSRVPALTLALVLVPGLVQTVLAQEPGSLWAFATYLVTAYSVAVAWNEARAAAGGAAVVGVLWLQEWLEHGHDYLFVVVVFGGAWLLGRLVTQWRARAMVAELNSGERARLAVAEERARIARELHDVVAHGVSVIAVQADAAQAVLDVDPERAREPLDVIRTSAREVLDEMRQLLALLRPDGDETVHPQPGLADVEELVASVRAAGLPVRLEVTGPAVALPVGADLSAYRIVQEALTNVLKHAGRASTAVLVQHADDAVTVEVRNAAGRPQHPAVAPGGHGLVGVRERVSLVGGRLDLGPTPDGGFVVRASLPRQPHRWDADRRWDA
ncbi:sensor histidine kinase [Angustibacter sp. Root456]|uniref:sensor histidine kinase n=1 Tax=Angustibacter sp. Root456 TaxID=1736539 RepID=UPI00138F6E8A|nr:sensor histidine kinase [Angustibacter sp. Root456]